jgi:hypothetical protein
MPSRLLKLCSSLLELNSIILLGALFSDFCTAASEAAVKVQATKRQTLGWQIDAKVPLLGLVIPLGMAVIVDGPSAA